MAHKYDSIRELDREGGEDRVVPELSIEGYMVPPPFEETKVQKMEHIRNIMITSERVANRSNRIRVENVCTGVLFEFDKMVDSARFLGVSPGNMRHGINYEVARVHRVGEEEYVFVYDGKERQMEGYATCPPSSGLVEVVSSSGERTPFSSYFSVAKHLGLLIGHVQEEKKRASNREPSRGYVFGKERYTLEFGGKRRKRSIGKDIVCHWKGIYDKDGDWEKIDRIRVTRKLHLMGK